jgi:hypothetical protein
MTWRVCLVGLVGLVGRLAPRRRDLVARRSLLRRRVASTVTPGYQDVPLRRKRRCRCYCHAGS